eukprot:scaffold155442_cov13-Tisochrysis_lutea.AAC.1
MASVAALLSLSANAAPHPHTAAAGPGTAPAAGALAAVPGVAATDAAGHPQHSFPALPAASVSCSHPLLGPAAALLLSAACHGLLLAPDAVNVTHLLPTDQPQLRRAFLGCVLGPDLLYNSSSSSTPSCAWLDGAEAQQVCTLQAQLCPQLVLSHLTEVLVMEAALRWEQGDGGGAAVARCPADPTAPGGAACQGPAGLMVAPADLAAPGGAACHGPADPVAAWLAASEGSGS